MWKSSGHRDEPMIGNVIAATDCTPEMMFDRPVEAVEFPLG
jgi:hypothetical protein